MISSPPARVSQYPGTPERAFGKAATEQDHAVVQAVEPPLFQRVAGNGGRPEGVSFVHVDVPPIPLACESTQVSLSAPLLTAPPKIVIVLLFGS